VCFIPFVFSLAISHSIFLHFRRSRTVKYQHLYPTMSFQETSIEDILSPSNPGSQQETVSQAVALQLMESTNVALEESELAGEWLLVQEQG